MQLKIPERSMKVFSNTDIEHLTVELYSPIGDVENVFIYRQAIPVNVENDAIAVFRSDGIPVLTSVSMKTIKKLDLILMKQVDTVDTSTVTYTIMAKSRLNMKTKRIGKFIIRCGLLMDNEVLEHTENFYIEKSVRNFLGENNA